MLRIEGILPGQTFNVSNSENILNRLNVGNILRAQVLEATSGELLLKLLDGTVFRASTSSFVNARQGEILELIVSNKTDKQISLETIKSAETKSGTSENDITKQLISLGLKPDKRNIEIARELLLNNRKLDANLFESISKSITGNKNLDIPGAVFVVANNMELEQTNIDSLLKLTHEKFKVGVSLDNLMHSLSEVDEPVFTNQIANKISDAKILKENLSKDLYDNFLSNDNFKDIISTDRILSFIKTHSNFNDDIYNKIQEFLKEEIVNFEKISPDDREHYINSIIKLLEKSKLSDHININQTQNDYLKDIRDNKRLVKAFEDFYVKLDSETLKDDLNIKDLYKNIYEKLEVVKQDISTSNIAARDQILMQIDDIQSNIRFINEISKHNFYVQIPINIGNRKTTGELYILKREGKRKKINPDNSTMFISLNMNSLGRIDSLINLKNKNITINMRLENQNVINFFKENFKSLYNSISEKGYKLVDVKYRIIEESIDVVKMNKELNEILKQNKESIDLRI